MCKSTHSATDESSVFAFNNKNLLSVEKYTWETIELATARLSWKNVYLGVPQGAVRGPLHCDAIKTHATLFGTLMSINPSVHVMM
jgi:hypothetical protein